MNAPVSSRRRPTETIREAGRLTHAMAVALGRAVKEGRIRLRLTQAELAGQVGVQQSWISRIELGHGHVVPLELWIALGVALGRPLAVSFSRPLGETREPTDAGHLAMQERLLALARATGRTATFELPTRPSDPSRSIDVCVRDAANRTLIIEEAWNTFSDVGAAARSTNRKVAEAADLAATIDNGPPYRVASVWIVRPSGANRALVGRYPGIFAAACPGPSRTWAETLVTKAPTPRARGLVWLDPATGRISAWRRPRDPRGRS
jgi:transcriptional regulator with XRE-family HTH domain